MVTSYCDHDNLIFVFLVSKKLVKLKNISTTMPFKQKSYNCLIKMYSWLWLAIIHQLTWMGRVDIHYYFIKKYQLLVITHGFIYYVHMARCLSLYLKSLAYHFMTFFSRTRTYNKSQIKIIFTQAKNPYFRSNNGLLLFTMNFIGQNFLDNACKK